MIPVLDEEERLGACLDSLGPPEPGTEILVVDGGSRDRTLELAASRPGVQVLESASGRARQMNLGADRSQGRCLWFLHADARPPASAREVISSTLSQPGVVAGAFRFSVESPRPAFRLIELGVRFRSEVLGIPYGDQGLFLSRANFEAVGGFPELGALEDLYLVRRLREKGRIRVLPIPLPTSARSWERRGLVGNTLRNWGLVLRDWAKPRRNPGR